jgi:hypothetical protein
MDENNSKITNVLVNLYSPYINFYNNKETLEKNYKILKNNYQLIIDDSIPILGCYICYINLNIVNKTKQIDYLKSGIVINDNNSLLTIKNRYRVWKINKEHFVIFKKLRKKEIFKLNILNIYHK